MTRFALVFLLLASAVFGQIGTSTITGRVTDASGAIIPNVSVAVVNTGTNFQFTAVTNADGLFRVQSLQPGPYRLTFEAAVCSIACFSTSIRPPRLGRARPMA